MKITYDKTENKLTVDGENNLMICDFKNQGDYAIKMEGLSPYPVSVKNFRMESLEAHLRKQEILIERRLVVWKVCSLLCVAATVVMGLILIFK